MVIEVIFDPDVKNVGQIRADLSDELNALEAKGLTITTVTAPPPAGTLFLHEVIKIVIENKEAIIGTANLLTAVLQLTGAALRRRGISTQDTPTVLRKSAVKKKKPRGKSASDAKERPAVIIKVGENQLNLPCNLEKQKKFIRKVAVPKAAG